MATVATLLAELALESASFHRDLGKAVSSLNSSSTQMNKALASVERQARTMNKVMGAAITGWVATLGVQAVKSANEFGSAIADMAKNTGLGTDALQEFRYAAGQAGGSTEAMDAALLKFTQVIGEAAQGSKQAVDALKRVGITTDELKSKNVDQLFVEASDALNKMGDSAGRNSAMVDLFGKSATKTAEAFSLSAKEMDGLRQAAHNAGAVLSEEAIAKAKVAADQFDSLAMVLKVQATAALVQFGPLLVKTTQFLADLGDMATWAAKQVGLLDKSEDDVYQDMLERRTDLADRLTFLQKAVTPGTIGGGIRDEIKIVSAELKKLDAQILDSINKQNAAKSAKPTPGTPAALGAVRTVTPVASKDDPTRNQYIVDLAEKRDALIESMASENDLIIQDHAYKLNLLSELKNQELIQGSEFNELKKQMEMEHQAELGDIWAQAALDRQKFDKMTYGQQAKTVFGFLAQITAGTAQHSKSMFEINKAAGIANAIISTYEGVAKAWSMGPILGPPLAGVVLAAGLAQVRAISQTSFGSASAPSVAGSTPAMPVTPVGDTGGGGRSPTTIVNLKGDFFSREAVRNLLESFNEEGSDGGRVVVV